MGQTIIREQNYKKYLGSGQNCHSVSDRSEISVLERILQGCIATSKRLFIHQPTLWKQ